MVQSGEDRKEKIENNQIIKDKEDKNIAKVGQNKKQLERWKRVSESFFVETLETITELLKGPNVQNQKIAIMHDFISVFKYVLTVYVENNFVLDD
jgi:hypothetical protein